MDIQQGNEKFTEVADEQFSRKQTELKDLRTLKSTGFLEKRYISVTKNMSPRIILRFVNYQEDKNKNGKLSEVICSGYNCVLK